MECQDTITQHGVRAMKIAAILIGLIVAWVAYRYGYAVGHAEGWQEGADTVLEQLRQKVRSI